MGIGSTLKRESRPSADSLLTQMLKHRHDLCVLPASVPPHIQPPLCLCKGQRLRRQRVQPMQDGQLQLERLRVNGLDVHAYRLAGLQCIVSFCQTTQIRCQRNKHAIVRLSADDTGHALPGTEPGCIFFPRPEQFRAASVPRLPSPDRVIGSKQAAAARPAADRPDVRRYTEIPQSKQSGCAAADVAERAERRKPCDHGRQNVPGPLFAEDLFQRCLLRAAPGQERRSIRCKAHDRKAYGPPHARQNRNIPRFAAKNAPRSLRTRNNALAAAECDMQIVPLVAFDCSCLQNFPLLHCQQQILWYIPPAAGAAPPEETDA